MLESVDSALDKAKTWEEFQRLVESSLGTIESTLEQSRWVSLTDDPVSSTSPELDWAERCKLLRAARLYYLKDPLIHQAASLITNYTFGDGLRYSCNNEEWKQELDDWWGDEDNLIELTSQQAQESKSVELIIDGEIFFILFNEPDGRVKVRTLPPEEITQIISHPDDYRRQLYYERKYRAQQYNFVEGTFITASEMSRVYYADWHNYSPGEYGFEQKMPAVRDGVIYHVAVNRLARQKRGNTETYPALDWAKAHRQMLQDWVTIVKAYSTLAWKAKIKGEDQRDIQRVRDKLMTVLPAFDPQSGQLRQPAGTAGIAFDNDAVSLTPMKTAGMATDPSDSRQIRLMAGAGLGIMEHYFGDAGNANLATAQAMELPMLKKFAARQRFWEDIYKNIMQYVIISGMEAGRLQGTIDLGHNARGLVVSKRIVKKNEDDQVIVQAPPILTRNMAEVAQAMVPLVENSLLLREDAARYTMKAMDLENIEEELVKLEAQWAKEDAAAEEMAKLALTANQHPDGPGNVNNPSGEKKPAGTPTSGDAPSAAGSGGSN